jgi:hypothetical protein
MASGTSREVTLTPTSSGTATATYTNASGCKSTQVFTINISGGSTIVTIANRATGLLIDGMGRTSAGSTCGQYASSGSWNQMWVLETSGAYVYIKNRNTGLYIDGRGVTTNGAYAGQWSSSTSNNLQWQQETTGSYVKFKNRATGLYLDGLGNTTNGADLSQWATSSSNNQQWTVSAVTSGASGREAVEVAMPEGMSTLSVTAHPNPVTGRITITLPEEMKEAAITILNVSGNVMIQEKASGVSHTLDVTELPAGLYLVRASKGVKSGTMKIIKQ